MPTLATNKQAHHDYEIAETWEAGLALTGDEVKAVKAGGASLRGSFVSVRPDSDGTFELFLVNCQVPHWRYSSRPLASYDPDRPRKLLLRKAEIVRLASKNQEKGLTLIPLQLYTKGSLIKLSVGLARSKKDYDKRAALKKRDLDRDLQRTLKIR